MIDNVTFRAQVSHDTGKAVCFKGQAGDYDFWIPKAKIVSIENATGEMLTRWKIVTIDGKWAQDKGYMPERLNLISLCRCNRAGVGDDEGTFVRVEVRRQGVSGSSEAMKGIVDLDDLRAALRFLTPAERKEFTG